MNWHHLLSDIDEVDELAKRLQGVEEGETIDFNKSFPRREDDSKGGLLGTCKSIGAFVNTKGGVIVVGAKEKEGVFTEIIGVRDEDWERCQQQINFRLRSLFAPVIQGVKFKQVQLVQDKFVALIYCPASEDGPHQLIIDGQNAFYPKRVGASLVHMTNDEIRSALLKPSEPDRIAAQSAKRLEALLNGTASIKATPPAWIIQAIPLESICELNPDDFNFQQRMRAVLNSLVGKSGGCLVDSESDICADGLIFPRPDVDRNLLVTREGGVELVCSSIEAAGDETRIPFRLLVDETFALISHILNQVAGEMRGQRWKLTASLIGAKDKRLVSGEIFSTSLSRNVLKQDKYDIQFIDLDGTDDREKLLEKIQRDSRSSITRILNDAGGTMPEPFVVPRS